MTASKNNLSIYKVLKENVNKYFEDKRKSRYANQVFWIKAIIYMLIPVAGYFMLFIFGTVSLLLVSAGYLLFNIGCTLLVVNVAHDASHQCLSRNKAVNRIMSYLWNIMGISKCLWEIQHHRSHHNHTGIPHRDVDIDENFWIRYNPAHPYRPYYRFQHLYAPFLYLLFGLFVVYVKDFIMLFSDKLKDYGIHKLPRLFLMKLIRTKILYIFISIIIPIWILPYAWWQLLIIYLVTLSISSGSMLVVLVMPHINADAVLYDENISIKNREDWALHQLHSNVDSSANSRWVSWLLGGLNTHLIHHLFPNICHIHYLPLTREIKQTLHEWDIPYKERSFVSGIIDHFKFLKLMGTEPAGLKNMNHSSSMARSHLHQ